MATTRDRKYKRILLKLSGEALMGEHEFGIDPKVLDRMALEIGALIGIGVQVGLVIGGGNLFRGAALSAAGMDRVTGDHMGMLATVMNGLAMAADRYNRAARRPARRHRPRQQHHTELGGRRSRRDHDLSGFGHRRERKFGNGEPGQYDHVHAARTQRKRQRLPQCHRARA